MDANEHPELLHCYARDEVLRRLNSACIGLSASEAERRRATFGPNTAKHPHAVAIEETSEEGLDAPFAERKIDELDPDLRHRLISDLAFARYQARGYVDGYDLEDWLDAEAQVDHMRLRANEDV